MTRKHTAERGSKIPLVVLLIFLLSGVGCLIASEAAKSQGLAIAGLILLIISISAGVVYRYHFLKEPKNLWDILSLICLFSACIIWAVCQVFTVNMDRAAIHDSAWSWVRLCVCPLGVAGALLKPRERKKGETTPDCEEIKEKE